MSDLCLLFLFVQDLSDVEKALASCSPRPSPPRPRPPTHCPLSNLTEFRKGTTLAAVGGGVARALEEAEEGDASPSFFTPSYEDEDSMEGAVNMMPESNGSHLFSNGFNDGSGGDEYNSAVNGYDDFEGNEASSQGVPGSGIASGGQEEIGESADAPEQPEIHPYAAPERLGGSADYMEFVRMRSMVSKKAVGYFSARMFLRCSTCTTRRDEGNCLGP